MNVQETIKYLEQHAYVADDVKDTAIKALEKHIPKKVTMSKGNCFSYTKDGTKDHEIICSCPSCGSVELIHGYPCKCGQLLDWN